MAGAITIRRFTQRDALPLSTLIGRTLLEENSKDYSLREIERLAGGYNPHAVKHMAQRGHLYVAEDKNTLLGCGAVGPHQSDPGAVWIHAVFTHPGAMGRGVGRAVMQALEADPLTQKAGRICLAASLTAEGFYRKLGYQYTGGTRTVAQGVVPMQKERKL